MFHRKDLQDKLFFAYCPERILPGNAIYERAKNDRVIGGINSISSNMAKLYEKFVDGNLFITNSKTAELCKLTENSSRDIQIAFANELSMICEKANVDVRELIDLANRHPRVNILNPMLSYVLQLIHILLCLISQMNPKLFRWLEMLTAIKQTGV